MKILNKRDTAGGLAAAVALTLAAQAAQSAEVWLEARAMTFQPAETGAAVLPMWGYVNCPGGFAGCPAPGPLFWAPGPVISVPTGDTALTVHLRNSLPNVSTSVVIPGLRGGTLAARTGTSPALTGLAALEAAPNGGVQAYEFTNVRPGTFLYHSGSDPRTQVQMGLYGAVAAAYPAGSFASQNQVLVFSEIDPALHGATPGTANMLDYAPRYFLINGKPDGLGGPPLAPSTAATAQATLLRLVNAGFADRAPQLLGAYFNVVGEDGNASPAGVQHSQYSALLAAGRTLDISVAAPEGIYPLYDRRLGLVNGDASGGGMRTSLVVSGAVPSPTAVADSYNAVFGTALNVGAPGVLGNDTPQLLTATRITNPADGTLTFNPDGSFQYQPVASGVTGPRSFTYTASNSMGTSAPATVTINVTPPGGGGGGSTNHAPTAVPDFFYITANTSGNGPKTATWNSPGVLASPGSTPDSDPDGDLLRVAPGSVTALSPVVAGQSRTVDTGTGATKGQLAFTYAYDWVGDATFNYAAQDINASPMTSPLVAVHIVRDFRLTAVTLLANVQGVQRVLPSQVTYELLPTGTNCPITAPVDTAVVAAGSTTIGTNAATSNAQTLRWTPTGNALQQLLLRAQCPNMTVRVQGSVPASGSVPPHPASSSVTVGFTSP